MTEITPISGADGGEEHEEGEISDEEPSPPSVEEEGQEPASRAQEDASGAPSSDRDPPLLQRRVSLDDFIQLGSESRPAGQTRKRTDSFRGRGELDLNVEDDGNGHKRNGWGSEEQPWQRNKFSPNGAYGSNLYNFAWAQAVSGRPTFSPGDRPTSETSPKLSGDRVSSGSPGLGTWSFENRKLSREISREPESCRSTGRSSEEREDVSPTGDNCSKSQRPSPERGSRTCEVTWAERPVTVRSRIEKGDRGGSDVEDSEGEGNRGKNQRSESPSSNKRLDEVDRGGSNSSEATARLGQKGDENGQAEDREEGELEEGEIELGPIPDAIPVSPTKEASDFSRQSKYNGSKSLDYGTKDKAYTRSASKSQPRTQIDDYSSRRHRQTKLQESYREKRFSLASELVKNVTVKDAQKSFVDVCGRLHKALRVLDELHTPKQSVQQEGRIESPQREVSALARQAFAGIRAVYAVRNTASGREQERDKNIFPRLLELANGYCQKLFTSKQTRELEVMMRTIANAGRSVRDGGEKVQYPRESQLQSAPKKSEDKDAKQGDPLESALGTIKESTNSESKSKSEGNNAGRGVLGFVDAKQAEEAAAIAAAALAYAQSSAAARSSPSFSTPYGSRSGGTSVSGAGAWGWPSESPPPVQFTGPGLNSFQPNNAYNATLMGNYQLWSETENRPVNPGQDGYTSHFLDPRAHDTLIAGSTAPENSRVDLKLPSGHSKGVNNSFGIPGAHWEEVNPPGAGTTSFVPASAVPVQSIGVKDESLGGKVWPPRPDMGIGSVPSYQNRGSTASVYSIDHLPSPTHENNRGAGSMYSVEQLPSPTHQISRGTAPMYALERLPSPTPDEGENVTAVPRLSTMETKPALLDLESKSTSVPMLAQGVGKLPVPKLLSGPGQNGFWSQSLDAPFTFNESKVQKENSGDTMLLPSTTRVSGAMEVVKNPQSLLSKGNIRSRDPRRRVQNRSLDLTDMLDLRSHVSSMPTLTGGEPHPAGFDIGKKRFAPADQVFGTEKRQKLRSESSINESEFNNETLHASAGTGGWLDDNVVPPFAPTEEGPMDMEVDDVGTVSAFEDKKVVGRDVRINGEERPEIQDLLKSNRVSKMQRMDVGQQMIDSGPRKMKLRDPRRALLESNVERGSSSSTESIRGDCMATAAASTSEVDPAASVSADGSKRIKIENTQTPIQDPSFPNIASPFMEKLSSLAGMVDTSPVSGSGTQGQRLAPSDGVQTAGNAEASVGPHTGDIVATTCNGGDVASVSSDLIPQGVAAQQNGKPPALAGPRKPKVNPSQWGASQVHPGLEQLLEDLSEEERLSVQLERQRRMEEQDRMFSAGKLCLVLDLDHTLLNSAKFSEIEPEWELRLRGAETAERNRTSREGIERRELYRFPHMSMWTKLRPGIWKFLARASQLFELHVYTMGNKVYATEMAKLLDPSGKLFAGRVISKGDDGDGDDLLPKSKDLDGVLGMESSVVIIDDSARVWPHHSQNLIVVERYMYFPCSRRQFGMSGPSLLEVGHDERESDGMLASVLGVIDRIHQSFFKNPRLREVDVREILAAQQRQVLAGCKVVFSRVFPVGEAEPHRHPLWRTAEQFGAICTITIDDQVTHVVAVSPGTDKVNWALETGRYVVRPAWLEASTILYRRANEREFPLLPQ